MDLPKGFDDPIALQKRLKTEPEEAWIARGEERALELFHQMAERVPAYRDFLKKYNVQHAKVQTIEDFQHVPLTDKDNYLRQYEMHELCWDGAFREGSWIISTTSGSSGEPFYFPRTDTQNVQYAICAELYLRENFHIHEKSTLYVNAFPLGPWIGGIFTYDAIRKVASRGGYALSIATPGIDKQAIIDTVVKMGKSYDQVIIGAYGPFLKDALDEGASQGVSWAEYNLGFIFSAEGFTEAFRDYVLDAAKVSDPFFSTLNHYGTVDLGTMAHETAECILLRKSAQDKAELAPLLFGEPHRQPTLCQYIPELFFFEEKEGALLCSADSGFPLVRYDLKDRGGVTTQTELQEKLLQADWNLSNALQETGLSEARWQLPFVHVFERADFSVSLYAFQIYPETIRESLYDKSISHHLTGKFSMSVEYDTDMNQQLCVRIELKRDASDSVELNKQVTQCIVNTLKSNNSEYNKTFSENPKRVTPNVIFCTYEDPNFFKPGSKQKWKV